MTEEGCSRGASAWLPSLVLTVALGLAALSFGYERGARRYQDRRLPGRSPGSDAAVGEQMRRGGVQAVADINAKGGVLGQQLSLDVGDDACDPKQAVAVANKFAGQRRGLRRRALLLLDLDPGFGGLCRCRHSRNLAGLDQSRLYRRSAKKGWNNVFRVCGRDDVQGKVAGDYIATHFKDKPVAIIDDKTTYGAGLADETRKALHAHGVTEAVDESINQGDKDFSALVSRMKQANVGVIYFGGYYTEAGLIVRQASEQGLKAPLIGGDALVTTEFWTITGNAGAGTLMTFSPDPRKFLPRRRSSPSSRSKATIRKAIRSTPMPRCRFSPRRQLWRSRRISTKSPKSCTAPNSTPCSARSASTPRATSSAPAM